MEVDSNRRPAHGDTPRETPRKTSAGRPYDETLSDAWDHWAKQAQALERVVYKKTMQRVTMDFTKLYPTVASLQAHAEEVRSLALLRDYSVAHTLLSILSSRSRSTRWTRRTAGT